MRMFTYWVRRLLAHTHRNATRSCRTRPRLEWLEDRAVPATITVTSAADFALGSVHAGVTLRDAIQAANTDTSVNGSAAGSGADTIVFDPALFASGPATISLTQFSQGLNGDEFGPTAFRISSDVTIQGPSDENGLTLQRDTAAANFRLFYVYGGAGTESAASLTLQDLTLSGGVARGGSSAAGGAAAGMGGAVFNRQGTLVLRNTLLANNTAQGGSTQVASFPAGGAGVGADASNNAGAGPNGAGPFSGDAGFGGGGGINTPIFNIFGGFGGGGGANYDFGGGGAGGFGAGGGGSTNGTSGGAGGFGGGGGATSEFRGGAGVGMGGAIFNESGTVSITNSTLTGNSALGGTGATNGQGLGGAIFTRNGTVTVLHGTLAGNTANEGGGSIFAVADANGGSGYTGGSVSVSLTNSILADTAGSATDFASAALGGASRTFSGTGNLIEVNAGSSNGFTGGIASGSDPLLGTLANNGGPSWTLALQIGSPAIGAGPFAQAYATTDQRDFVRPGAGNIDLGAYQSTALNPLLVTTTADVVDGFDGVTSLREAVAYANFHPGADTITFAPGLAGGTVTVSLDQLLLTDATGATTVAGPGAGLLTIDGGWDGIPGSNTGWRIIQVARGATATFSGLTFRHGSGYQNYQTFGRVAFGGGAVSNLGTLTVQQCVIRDNWTGKSGGGLENYGTLDVVQSTVSNNIASESGGGIGNTTNFSPGVLRVTQSTVVGNVATGTSQFQGGAITSNGGGTVTTIRQSTIAGNSAGANSGGVCAISGAAVTVAGSLVVGNTVGGAAADTGGAVGGTVTDGGGNLIGLPAGVTLGQVLATAAGSPLLADNGGPTPTVALVPGSPAVGAGVAIAGLTTDQRGVARNAIPDAGAYETVTPTVSVTVAGGVYNGGTYGVTSAVATAPGGMVLASFNPDGNAFALSFRYYLGATLLPGAPKDVGDYTAVAVFTNVVGFRDATSAPAAFSITPAALTVTADPGQGKTYGDPDPTLTYRITAGGLVGGDSLSGTITRAAAGEAVGFYGIGQGNLTAGLNYDLTFVSANFEIRKAILTVVADANPSTPAQDAFTKVFGSADPALTYRATGFRRADRVDTILSGGLTRDPGEGFGMYAVRQGSLVVNGNYTIQFTDGVLNIRQLGGSIVSTQIDDGNAQRSMVRSLSVTFSDVIAAADVPAVLAQLRLTRISDSLAIGLTGTLDGTGKTLTLKFTGTGILGGSLADGRYALTYADTAVTSLHRLFGDIDGNAEVNAADQAEFNKAMNTRRGLAANYSAYLDYTQDGLVINSDQTEFGKRKGKKLDASGYLVSL